MVYKKLKKGTRILITGGAGFIGGYVIRRLLKESEVEIFNLDKLNYASNIDGVAELNLNSRHKLLKYDLSNSEETHKAVSIARPDFVMHLAAESHVDRSIEKPFDFINSNIIGTFNLLESIRRYWQSMRKERKMEFRFHHISTDEVFGSLDNSNKFTETTPYCPRSPYAASKASSDHLINAWHHTFGIPIVTTNCSNNFGPWQFPEKLIPLVITKAMNQEEIPIYGDGKYIRDWIYVEDHVDALLLALEKGKVGKSYCIGAECEKSNIEVIQLICKLLDKKLKSPKPSYRLIKYVKDRPGHDRRYSIDSSYARKELGWKANHSFEEALSKTIDWYIENQSWCKRIQESSNYYGERLGIRLH